MYNLFNIINKLHNTPKKQSGAVLMVMLVILVVGASAILISSLNNRTLQIARDQITSQALAQAKEALIAYAITSEKFSTSSSARPGNFPCPDKDAPGASGYGDEDSSCSSGGGTTIGRLPWKSLGLPELVDADGEPLWYVLSDNFRKAASIINSDTLGTLQIYDHDGITSLTPSGSEAVAIVFAPGSIINGQSRSSNIVNCITTGTAKAENLCAANYLEAANGRNNASTIGPFIFGEKSTSFNDRMINIRTRDFIPAIEKRVSKELITILGAYYAANGFYPYPAPFGTCQDIATCTSSASICRGRFPYTAQPAPWVAGSYQLPKTSISNWFKDNLWFRVIYYSAGTSSLSTIPSGCNPTLVVSGTSKNTLLIMPGTPMGAITRTYPNNNISWYLEDTENTNLDDVYVTPTINSNDQLYAIP